MRISITIVTALFALLYALNAYAADKEEWPGSPPDCWPEPRNVHSLGKDQKHWEKHFNISTRKGSAPTNGDLSPNKAYRFAVQVDGEIGKITIFAEKDTLTELNFTALFGLEDVHWINEKLIFVRAWWGRVEGTDFIFDVENTKLAHVERVTDTYLIHQQYMENCPLVGGCRCIKKK